MKHITNLLIRFLIVVETVILFYIYPELTDAFDLKAIVFLGLALSIAFLWESLDYFKE